MSPVLIVGALLGQHKMTKPHGGQRGEAVRAVEGRGDAC